MHRLILVIALAVVLALVPDGAAATAYAWSRDGIGAEDHAGAERWPDGAAISVHDYSNAQVADSIHYASDVWDTLATRLTFSYVRMEEVPCESITKQVIGVITACSKGLAPEHGATLGWGWGHINAEGAIDSGFILLVVGATLTETYPVVAIHEMGHALGLGHSERHATSVMYWHLTPGMVSPGDHDIEALWNLGYITDGRYVPPERDKKHKKHKHGKGRHS